MSRNEDVVQKNDAAVGLGLQDIWTELSGRVRKFVGNRVSDPATADDIAQDVMLKVQSQLHDLPPGEKLPSWVFAVARNGIIDYYRAREVRKHADINDHEVVTSISLIDKQDAIHDLTPCLTRMVELLPEPYREAMKLAELEGLRQQEIADRTGISLSGVKSRVQRARQQLRGMLLDCCKVERDARGNVFDYQTTVRSRRYCGNDEGQPACGS